MKRATFYDLQIQTNFHFAENLLKRVCSQIYRFFVAMFFSNVAHLSIPVALTGAIECRKLFSR